jgi:hypothetical protein
MKRLKLLLLAASMTLASSALQADDLSGASDLLCTSVQATICYADGDCEIGAPWNWNVPQFIEIDLEQKTLSTTEASGENRATPIKSLEYSDGLIFLQGIENGRAFSFVIDEATGFASVAVARAGITVSVFGACTPMPS